MQPVNSYQLVIIDQKSFNKGNQYVINTMVIIKFRNNSYYINVGNDENILYYPMNKKITFTVIK